MCVFLFAIGGGGGCRDGAKKPHKIVCLLLVTLLALQICRASLREHLPILSLSKG